MSPLNTNPNRSITSDKSHHGRQSSQDDLHKHQDASDEQAKYLPTFPDVKWDPLVETMDFVDKGHKADPKKRSLLEAATAVEHLTPLIGTELSGIDMRHLTEQQKNDLALLVAERGVVFFRNQQISVEEQGELSNYLGPAYRHPSSGIPEGLDEVQVIYTDSESRRKTGGFTKNFAWHSDASYEQQPPGIAMLKMLTVSEYGCDTMWASCTGLYSLLSPHLQEYIEKLEVLHSGLNESWDARALGLPLRREYVENTHPVVRVHPVTGWKSIFVNSASATRIVKIPKSESDAVLELCNKQLAENPDLQLQFRLKKNDVAIWDNRVVCHTSFSTGGVYTRHGVQVMHTAELPLSIGEFEKTYGRVAEDRKGRMEINEVVDLPVQEKKPSTTEPASVEVQKVTPNPKTEDSPEQVVVTVPKPIEAPKEITAPVQRQKTPLRRSSWGFSEKKWGILAPFHWIRISKGTT
ncbi:hypothetical protein FRC02_012405 [Tulasnella sp. 418]|nr:hypothetical protein FRC02_012405 [Tulasnella sp. 418]